MAGLVFLAIMVLMAIGIIKVTDAMRDLISRRIGNQTPQVPQEEIDELREEIKVLTEKTYRLSVEVDVLRKIITQHENI